MLEALNLIFNITCLAAGLGGAIVHVCIVEEKMAPNEVMKYLVTGMIAANYLAPQMFRILPLFPIEFLAFGVGMTGKILCLKLTAFFEKIDLFGKAKNE